MAKSYDFSGWATRANVRCSDGRTIMPDAFKDCDGKVVPLVWNHQHNDVNNILGHALLKSKDGDIFAYCKFNDTESGQAAKMLVQHGDIRSLSIMANQLKQRGSDVIHGVIRELSLVLASANPTACITDIQMAHGEDADGEAYIFNTAEVDVQHGELMGDEVSAEESKSEEETTMNLDENALKHADDEKKPNSDSDKDGEDNETVADVFNTLNEKQKNVVYALIGQALEDSKNADDNEEDEKEMKHNVFDNEVQVQDGGVLSHADQMDILELAKRSNVGSLQTALRIYAEENDTLKHGISDDDISALFPEYKDVRPGAPELIERDQSWVSTVMNGVRKSPISRIRTRQADARGVDLRGKGYKKGSKKSLNGNIKLMNRTTDPQTIYVKEQMNRDDIIDITDFDVVAWVRGLMRRNLNEEIAGAILFGDGREEGEADKISETHVHSIYNDDELYTMHVDVDIEAARKEIQGSNTDAYFGENYIYTEAIITAALYAREKYKGSGTPVFFCTPHLVNVMLLARDMNGRRIYDSKSDLVAALNVSAIHTVEQMEGKGRTTEEGDEKKLLGIFVNLDDYQVGATRGGEITSFNQFDIDFNQEKYLMEARMSGALTRLWSAIALEEPVPKGVEEP